MMRNMGEVEKEKKAKLLISVTTILMELDKANEALLRLK